MLLTDEWVSGKEQLLVKAGDFWGANNIVLYIKS